jgi:hypothetical protein
MGLSKQYPDDIENLLYYVMFYGHNGCNQHAQTVKNLFCRVTKAEAEVERLRSDLSEAVRYLREAKEKFTPNTTNSLVDDFLAKIDDREVG